MKSDRPSAARRITMGACAAMMAAAIGGTSDEAIAVQQIERYCTTSWRNAQISEQDWSDCTQQAIVSLLERIPRDRLVDAIKINASDERRELNRSIWRTIQRWRRARRCLSLGSKDWPDHRADDVSEARSDVDPRGAHLTSAMARLTSRQQVILTRWSQGSAISEIARSLKMSPAQASDEKYKALKKLRRHFADRVG